MIAQLVERWTVEYETIGIHRSLVRFRLVRFCCSAQELFVIITQYKHQSVSILLYSIYDVFNASYLLKLYLQPALILSQMTFFFIMPYQSSPYWANYVGHILTRRPSYYTSYSGWTFLIITSALSSICCDNYHYKTKYDLQFILTSTCQIVNNEYNISYYEDKLQPNVYYIHHIFIGSFLDWNKVGGLCLIKIQNWFIPVSYTHLTLPTN